MLLIRRGSVKISRRDGEGNDITRSYLPAGHYVGEMALLSKEPLQRSATVTAAVGSETLLIGKDDLLSMLQHSPKVMERITRVARDGS